MELSIDPVLPMNSEKSASPGRILYVDDDPDISEIAAIALEQIGGYQVEVCRSGDEASEHARRFCPDLILLDINMPGLDGPETLEAMRAVEAISQTPVIFISGDSRARAVVNRYRARALGLIEKPFDPLELPELVAGLWRAGEPDSVQSLELKLEALRKRFMGRLPERLRQLRLAWAEAVDSGFDPSTLERAHRVAHNLAGATGAHGMEELSDRLRRATRLLRRWQESRHHASAEEQITLSALIGGDDGPEVRG